MIDWLWVFLAPPLLGMLMVALFVPGNLRSPSYLSLLFFSGLGAGLALTSVLYFIAILLEFPLTRLIWLEGSVGAVLLILIQLRRAYVESPYLEMAITGGENDPNRRKVVFLYAFLIIAGLAALNSYSAILLDPHGGWDAIAMWNLKARFFFRDPANWTEIFNLEALHAPAHPLLLPTCVARGWTLIGSENPIVPQTIGLLFGIGATGLLMTILAIFRSWKEACLGGLVLQGVSEFSKLAASQTADVPAGYLFLCALTFSFLALQASRNSGPLWFLAGLFISFTAWLKNEGLVYLLSIVLARYFLSGSRKFKAPFLREMAAFLGGAFPVTLLTILFRSYAVRQAEFTYPVDLYPQWSLLGDFGRLWDVIWITLTSPGSLTRLTLPAFIVYLILARPRFQKGEAAGLYTLAVTLVFCVLGYLYIFANTTHQLAFYIPGTWPRLQLHLLPAFILVSVLATSGNREGTTDPQVGPSPLDLLPDR